MSDFAAEAWYECPLCLDNPEESEKLEDWGEVRVDLYIEAGEPEVRYPNSRAHPGSPPTIDYFDIGAGTPCRHSDEEIHAALEETVHNDFDDGKIDMEVHEPDHPDI